MVPELAGFRNCRILHIGRIGKLFTMPVPLNEAKADFFKMLGHPIRIRVLELLQEGPQSVQALLAEIGIEPPALSQQLGVLRRSGVVTSRRERSQVIYELTSSDFADLLAVARRILTEVLADQNELLVQLREVPADNAG